MLSYEACRVIVKDYPLALFDARADRSSAHEHARSVAMGPHLSAMTRKRPLGRFARVTLVHAGEGRGLMGQLVVATAHRRSVSVRRLRAATVYLSRQSAPP